MITLTERQIKEMLSLKAALIRTQAERTDLYQEDDGSHHAAYNIAAICGKTAELYTRVDALQEEIGTEVMKQDAKGWAAHYTQQHDDWDQKGQSRYNKL